jgi:hypothetical protein
MATGTPTGTPEKNPQDRRIGDRDARRRENSKDPNIVRARAGLPDLASRVLAREEDAAELRQSLLAEKSVRDERIRRSLAEATRTADVGERAELED